MNNYTTQYQNYFEKSNVILCTSRELVTQQLPANESLKVHVATGVYDIVHPGHVWSINYARSLGCNYIIACVAPQESAIRKHGYGWFTQYQRAFMISPYVDMVYLQSANEYSSHFAAWLQDWFPDPITIIKGDMDSGAYSKKYPDEVALYKESGVELLHPKSPYSIHGSSIKRIIRKKML